LKEYKDYSSHPEENGVGYARVYILEEDAHHGHPEHRFSNMINALLSLNLTYSIPLPIIASWRGVYKESIEAQWQFGKRMPEILSASG